MTIISATSQSRFVRSASRAQIIPFLKTLKSLPIFGSAKLKVNTEGTRLNWSGIGSGDFDFVFWLFFHSLARTVLINSIIRTHLLIVEPNKQYWRAVKYVAARARIH